MSEPTPIPQSQRELDRLAIERAATLAQQIAEPGHVFTHAWIDEALELPPQPFGGKPRDAWNLRRGMLIIEWCDSLLRLYHIHVENVRSRGYMVINPQETARVATKIVSRDLEKSLASAGVKIQEAGAEGLTDRQIQERHDALAWLGRIEMVRRNQRPRPPKRPHIRSVNADTNDNESA